MTFYIMTLFPDMIDAVMGESIIGRAIENGLLFVKTYNIRDLSTAELMTIRTAEAPGC